MLSATIKLLARDVAGVFRRAELYLIALGTERRCAMRLDRVGDRLTLMGAKIDLLRSRMNADVIDEAVDIDCMLRDALKALKEDIRGIRCQLASMHSQQLSARLRRAFSRLSKISEETYAGADKLQWEIDEHDRPFYGE